MRAAILLGAGLVLFAADKDAPKKEAKKQTETVDRTKQADAWVEKVLKDTLPENVPRWNEVFDALERKYGRGKVPCGTFDSARDRYFKEFIRPRAQKEGSSVEGWRQEFMKITDLPTTWTLTGGQRRKGCLEE